MKRILKCVRNTLLALLLGNNFANATGLNNEQGSASLALGHLGGEAKEYVYNGDNKLSEITWKINNAAIIKGNAQYNILSWLDLKFQGWTTLAKGSGSNID